MGGGCLSLTKRISADCSRGFELILFSSPSVWVSLYSDFVQRLQSLLSEMETCRIFSYHNVLLISWAVYTGLKIIFRAPFSLCTLYSFCTQAMDASVGQ